MQMGALRGWAEEGSHAAAERGGETDASAVQGWGAQDQLLQMCGRSGRVDGGQSKAAWDGGLLNPRSARVGARALTLRYIHCYFF